MGGDEILKFKHGGENGCEVDLVRQLIEYVDSLMPGVSSRVELFTEIDNAGGGAGFGVMRNTN